MHFGKTPEKSIFFLLCYWQAKRNTSHLKPLSQSFRNIYLPHCEENSKGVLGAWDLKQDAGHLQRPGRVSQGCTNPIFSYCESAFFFFLFVATAHKKLTAQFMFKHSQVFQRSPLIPSRNQLSSHSQIFGYGSNYCHEMVLRNISVWYCSYLHAKISALSFGLSVIYLLGSEING